MKPETHIALTADGWHVALWRYVPRRPLEAPPVVLCHGLGATRFNLDFDEKYSLAQYLCRKGFDAFVVELRGSGLAGRLSKAKLQNGPWLYDFDDHFDSDLPAVLDAVTELTGHERVSWIGHSMGGILAYGMMGTDLEQRLHTAVVIAAPAGFGYQKLRFSGSIEIGLRLFRRRLPATTLTKLIAPLSGWLRTPIGDVGFANFRNMEKYVIKGTLRQVIGDVSRGQLIQTADWVNSDRVVSSDGNTDYLAGLADSVTPTLFITGSLDRIAPPAAVRKAFDAHGGEKEMIVIGRDSGLRSEYGHVDIVLGRDAPGHLFPQIARWLVRQSQPGNESTNLTL